MSLALTPDNIDRYGDHSDYNHDDDDRGGHLPFARIGTVSDTALDSNSTLAGIDEITALKWKYEDKMVTMGLVFGSSTIPTEASSGDISTVSSFERFMTAPTPPPFTEPSVTVSRLLHKSTGADSPLPVYTADTAVGVKSEKSLASPQLDTPAPIFLQPVRPGVEDTPAPVPAPQDSVAPTLDLRVPYDQWRFGV
ncbi:hypothetical protein QFC22_001403 [Naganishia vaughanmartiniae]|uniref:Uncharacterized protein n=1 Tax=Naganishia vaughanmartiniae TaxID=1424756 RepID=A0ACC2XII9_9TREE|nr:hypothetical protein QFC22_001403 [Naganishia vaughanmartiniae]